MRYIFFAMSAFLVAPTLMAQSYVVVERNVAFYATSSATQPVLESKKAEGYMTLTRVKRSGKRTQVLLKALAESCYFSGDEEGLELRFWIENKDLETVTNKILTFTLENGSTAVALPGLVVKQGHVSMTVADTKLKVGAANFSRSFIAKSFDDVPKRSNEIFSPFYKESSCLKLLLGPGKPTPPEPRFEVTTAEGVRVGSATKLFLIGQNEVPDRNRFCFQPEHLDATAPRLCVDKSVMKDVKAIVQVRDINVIDGDQKQATRWLVRYSKFYRRCYEDVLKSEPTLGSGDLSLFFNVNSRGVVTELTLSQSTLQSEEVAACVSKIIKRIRFARPKNQKPSAGIHAKIVFRKRTSIN